MSIIVKNLSRSYVVIQDITINTLETSDRSVILAISFPRTKYAFSKVFIQSVIFFTIQTCCCRSIKLTTWNDNFDLQTFSALQKISFFACLANLRRRVLRAEQNLLVCRNLDTSFSCAVNIEIFLTLNAISKLVDLQTVFWRYELAGLISEYIKTENIAQFANLISIASQTSRSTLTRNTI